MVVYKICRIFAVSKYKSGALVVNENLLLLHQHRNDYYNLYKCSVAVMPERYAFVTLTTLVGVFICQNTKVMSNNIEAQGVKVSGGAEATAESYNIIKSGTIVTQEEYTTIARLFERHDLTHLIGCQGFLSEINNEFSDYFKSLPQAIMVLAQHANDNEGVKAFINSLTAVNGVLSAITEFRTQLSDLEYVLSELEQADLIYTVQH